MKSNTIRFDIEENNDEKIIAFEAETTEILIQLSKNREDEVVLKGLM
jgi:hypothetical protein